VTWFGLSGFLKLNSNSCENYEKEGELLKKVLLLLVLFMFIIPMTVAAFSFQDLPNSQRAVVGSAHIGPRTLDGERVGGVTLSGIVPDVVGSESLAERIDNIVSSLSGGGTGSVELSYRIVRATNYFSIVFLAETVTTAGSRSATVATLAIEEGSLNTVRVSDLLGSNGTRIATDVVNRFIAQNFRSMPRIPALENDAFFYVTNEAVFFVFDRYEIAPGSEGIQAVPVYFEYLNRYILSEDDFRINVENHGVRMLPLRRLAERFGYTVVWDPDTHEMKISRANSNGNGNGYITLRLNENAYKRVHDLTPRALEAAPEIIDGSTFVPISFFEAILDIHYNILADGTIELTAYQH